MRKILIPLTTLYLLLSLGSATEFSIAPEENFTVTADYRAFPAYNERHCVMLCKAQERLMCSAASFVPETGLCLLSTVRNASFGAAGGSGLLFRRKFQPYIVGGRVFYRIQQRVNGRVSFARNWTEYENGFGDGFDFWIGLKKIHELTGNIPRRLRVEAVTWSDEFYFCEYSGFTVADASTNYTMTYGSYLSASSNMSSNSLTYHKGMQFSTLDRDNDIDSDRSCSNKSGNGGWWFNGCYESNPNGIYRHLAVENVTAMIWKGATSGMRIAIKSIRLLIEAV